MHLAEIQISLTIYAKYVSSYIFCEGAIHFHLEGSQDVPDKIRIVPILLSSFQKYLPVTIIILIRKVSGLHFYSF